MSHGLLALILRDETLRVSKQLEQLSSKSKPKHFEVRLFVGPN
jgi:hypothetical protein